MYFLSHRNKKRGRAKQLIGSREEYLEFHESSFELAIQEEYDNLPDECQTCTQLGFFNNCKLAKYKVDEFDCTCPLEYLTCEQCQFFCRIVQQDGTPIDYGFCSEKEHELQLQERACQGFVPYEERKKNNE